MTDGAFSLDLTELAYLSASSVSFISNVTGYRGIKPNAILRVDSPSGTRMSADGPEVETGSGIRATFTPLSNPWDTSRRLWQILRHSVSSENWIQPEEFFIDGCSTPFPMRDRRHKGILEIKCGDRVARMVERQLFYLVEDGSVKKVLADGRRPDRASGRCGIVVIRTWPIHIPWMGLFLFFILGCRVAHPPVGLPAKFTLENDHLVVQSDVKLSRNHELLKDLDRLQAEILTTLDLPDQKQLVVVYLLETKNVTRTIFRRAIQHCHRVAHISWERRRNSPSTPFGATASRKTCGMSLRMECCTRP